MNNGEFHSRSEKHRRQHKIKRPFYKKSWFIVLMSLLAIVILVNIFSPNKSEDEIYLKIKNQNVTLNNKIRADIKFDTNPDNKFKLTDSNGDLVYSDRATNRKWDTLTMVMSGKYKLTVYKNGKSLSKKITVKPLIISTKQKPSTDSKENSNVSTGSADEVPVEYSNAFVQARQYSDMMSMSKQAIFEQLSSPDGGKFPTEAAQYAVDNLQADYNKNALESAKTYQKEMNMSNEDIRQQLASPDGGKFTQAEANYAIAHLSD
ncbi:Ltp family lipoprotein [Companilactobacillus jidongensis]|uniref:Ltp family lipoprotein n=1 Tax=Companilactobacillus jidongensis TaxID=2486006 RepID=UPI001CDD7462|nr:Ltp family lipoprotein [Companilactobacillus jidongensis]